MSGFNPVPFLRRAAALAEWQLGVGFAAGMLLVLLLRAAAGSRPTMAWLNIPAALLALTLVSVLFSVVAFYRDDDLLEGGVLLAAVSGIGTGVAVAIVATMMSGSLGGAVVLAATGSFLLLLRLAMLVPLYMGLLWAARKFRRVLAPDTLP